VTDSPSEPNEEQEAPEGEEPTPIGKDRSELAASVAQLVGAIAHTSDFSLAKVQVNAENWAETILAARDSGLDFFSFLSAIDWSKEVAVGDPVDDVDSLQERYEVLCALGTTEDDRYVVFSADVPKEGAAIQSLVDVFSGANWHEREAHEMFGIDFVGHPNLIKLYLPDAFEGYPLRKSYPLLSREVKPWPGKVDVEDMPSTENPEAGDAAQPAEEAE